MNQNREQSLINRLQVSHHNQAKMVLYIERIIVCKSKISLNNSDKTENKNFLQTLFKTKRQKPL